MTLPAAQIPVEELSGLEGLGAEDVLRRVLNDPAFGRVAVVSSFGTESAALLHLVAQVKKDTPILFINTRKLFGETLRYADKLAARLELSDLRILTPDNQALMVEDPQGDLWNQDADRCCAIRKVEPLQVALSDFDTWISGRKRYQSTTRAALPVAERDGGRLKINPLASWSREEIVGYMDAHDLPRHPLEEDGYLSIGCYTCSDRVAEGEDIRAGRWRGQGKTECGIHVSGMSSRLPVR